MKDLRELPKLRDSLSYLFCEHCNIEQDGSSISLFSATQKTQIPVASLGVLMLGPGTTITHAAVKTICENGCSIIWCGSEQCRFYACGTGETRKARHLLHQAKLVSDEALRMKVAMKMYEFRFESPLDTGLTIEQIRGFEGIRVRRAYEKAAQKYGVSWKGRHYNRFDWNDSDPANKAFSMANAILNSICHTAIVSGGYSPALGFIHTGKQLSFVYDIADLYKATISIPAAFSSLTGDEGSVEKRVRTNMREIAKKEGLLHRILPDIDQILAIEREEIIGNECDIESDAAQPLPLWPVQEAF